MRTLIDGSSLLAVRPTGVTVAVRALLAGGLLPIEGEATITTYGRRIPDPALIAGLPHPWRHHAIPSKLVHALCAGRLSSFDRLFGPAGRILLPNLNIVGIPRVPYDLLIHDLSFLVHPEWFSYKTRLWHRFARPEALIRNAERLFAVSSWTKEELVALLDIPAARITTVPIPASPPLETDGPRPLSQPYFLLFSAHDERKNSRCAELAFAEFARAHPDWRLVLVGARLQPSHPNIIHLPYLDPQAQARWLKHAAALLYPSWYEGFGLPPREAAGYGVPTLAADTGIADETPVAGLTLLPAQAPHFWVAAMERIKGSGKGLAT